MSNVPPPPPGMPPPPPGMPLPPEGGMYATGPVAPNGQALASAGMRIGARLIEFVIGIVVGLIFYAIIAGSGNGGVGGLGGKYNAGSVLLSLAFGWAIEAGLTATKGGSIGKLILGLRVVNASDGTTPVSWLTATIRWAIPGAFSLVPILGGIAGIVVWIVSIVFLFTDKLRQTVSDKVAKTLVVVK